MSIEQKIASLIEESKVLQDETAEQVEEITEEEVDLDEEEIEEGKWNYPSEYTKKPDAEQRERDDVFGSTQKADRKEFRKAAKSKAHKALMTGKLTKEEV